MHSPGLQNKKYLSSLDIQCNCTDPSVVPDLAEVIGTINTLEILFMGALSLSANAKHINSLGLYLEKLYADVCELDVKDCQMIEILNYEFQRHKISGYIKVNHKLDYPLFSNADVVFINSYY